LAITNEKLRDQYAILICETTNFPKVQGTIISNCNNQMPPLPNHLLLQVTSICSQQLPPFKTLLQATSTDNQQKPPDKKRFKKRFCRKRKLLTQTSKCKQQMQAANAYP
jgi:hypothetical protein